MNYEMISGVMDNSVIGLRNVERRALHFATDGSFPDCHPIVEWQIGIHDAVVHLYTERYMYWARANKKCGQWVYTVGLFK